MKVTAGVVEADSVYTCGMFGMCLPTFRGWGKYRLSVRRCPLCAVSEGEAVAWLRCVRHSLREKQYVFVQGPFIYN